MKIIIQHLEDLQDAQGPPELYEAAATPGEEVAEETPAADGQVAGNAVETLVPEVPPSATSRSTCGSPQHRLANPCFQLWGSCNL